MPNEKIKPVLEFAAYMFDKASRWLSALIVLIVIAFLAFIYNNSTTIYGDIARIVGEKNFIAKLDATKFATEMPKLVKNSGAVNGTVWIVDLASNTRKVVYSYNATTDTQSHKQFFGYETTFYGDIEAENLKLVEMQKSKDAVCFELIPESDFEALLRKDGANYICEISVPPQAGQFIGMIALGFTKFPGLNDKEWGVFNRRMYNTANRITRFSTRAKAMPLIGTDN